MDISLRQWLREHRDKLHDDGLKRCAMHGAYTAFLGLWYTLSSRRPIGRNVYDADWDLLIVLDACRVDALEAVADDYEFIDAIDRVLSVGSHSREWLAGTFTRQWCDEVARTAMITGNGHTQPVFFDNESPPKETVPFCWPNWDPVSGETFARLEMIWQDDHPDGYGVPPRPITDRTISIGRDENHDRLIAHYMQPHVPYIAEAIREDRERTEIEARGWEHLKSGAVDEETHWQLYEANLRFVLDEVEILLDNVDAERVVITADHGNAFGEFGAYGHPEGFLHPNVKVVPWVVTSATDSESHIPEPRSEGDVSTSMEDHLEAMGYL
jgi:hypothetical protein